MKVDVAIIGAGAAGLSAARRLSGAGKRVCILKARDRVGGRVHPLHVPDLALPIELGAEFMRTRRMRIASARPCCARPTENRAIRNSFASPAATTR